MIIISNCFLSYACSPTTTVYHRNFDVSLAIN